MDLMTTQFNGNLWLIVTETSGNLLILTQRASSVESISVSQRRGGKSHAMIIP